MIEVAPRLWVGSAKDYETQVKGKEGWAVVHACKEPYHRRLLGYTGRSAPEGPERLVARRGDELYLNLIDAPQVEYISGECVREATRFIDGKLMDDLRVLVHCNKGESRAPSIAFIYLAFREDWPAHDAPARFRCLYPFYQPGAGMAAYVERALTGGTV